MIDKLYAVKHRIKLVLGLYGYVYALYLHDNEPAWAWYEYLYRDLSEAPHPIACFIEYAHAWNYMNKYPQTGLYIRHERYIQ